MIKNFTVFVLILFFLALTNRSFGQTYNLTTTAVEPMLVEDFTPHSNSINNYNNALYWSLFKSSKYRNSNSKLSIVFFHKDYRINSFNNTHFYYIDFTSNYDYMIRNRFDLLTLDSLVKSDIHQDSLFQFPNYETIIYHFNVRDTITRRLNFNSSSNGIIFLEGERVRYIIHSTGMRNTMTVTEMLDVLQIPILSQHYSNFVKLSGFKDELRKLNSNLAESIGVQIDEEVIDFQKTAEQYFLSYLKMQYQKYSIY